MQYGQGRALSGLDIKHAQVFEGLKRIGKRESWDSIVDRGMAGVVRNRDKAAPFDEPTGFVYSIRTVLPKIASFSLIWNVKAGARVIPSCQFRPTPDMPR